MEPRGFVLTGVVPGVVSAAVFAVWSPVRLRDAGPAE
jgi:hypothetical protein